MTSRLLAALVIGAALHMSVATANAQSTQWLGQSGTFDDPTKWSNGVPDQYTATTIHQALSSSATFVQNHTSGPLVVSAGDTTFELNNQTLNLESLSSSPFNILAGDAGQIASVTVNGSGAMTFSAAWQIGRAGTGTLNISGSAKVTTNNAILYVGGMGSAVPLGLTNGGNGTLNVTGSGSQLNINSGGALYVGNGATPTQGTLHVTNGGEITVSNLYAGNGGTAGIHVGSSTTLSRPTANNSIYLGSSSGSPGSTATLTINSGGLVASTGVSSRIYLYAGGTLNLQGGELHIGLDLVRTGGTFDWSSGTLRATNGISIGDTTTGKTLTVNDDKRLLVSNGPLAISTGATLNFDGGEIEAKSFSNAGTFNWTRGTLRILDPYGTTTLNASTFGSNLALNDGRRLEVRGTMQLISNSVLTVTNTDASFQRVAASGTGYMQVNNGGHVAISEPTSATIRLQAADGAFTADTAELSVSAPSGFSPTWDTRAVGGLGSSASFRNVQSHINEQHTIRWRTRNEDEDQLRGDVLQFTVTSDGGYVRTNAFLLQMTYSDAGLTLAQERMLGLAALSDSGWTNALDLNFGANTGLRYLSSYLLAGQPTALGAHGVDTSRNTVWAVLDHNRAMSIMAIIPEPASLAMLAFGSLLLLRRPRHDRWRSPDASCS